MPLHVSSTMFSSSAGEIALHSLWYHHTYRCDDTRGCIMQFWSPDDEHMCSKHVEAWNKTYCKTKILCIKLVKYWDKYTAMHGQQNVKTNIVICRMWQYVSTSEDHLQASRKKYIKDLFALLLGLEMRPRIHNSIKCLVGSSFLTAGQAICTNTRTN